MKIRHPSLSGKGGAAAPAHGERGMATILFIMLLAIMMILIAANVRTVLHLRVEEKLIEQRQIQRLNAPPTNAVATVAPPAETAPK